MGDLPSKVYPSITYWTRIPTVPSFLISNEHAFDISMASVMRFIEICALKESEPRSVMLLSSHQMRRKSYGLLKYSTSTTLKLYRGLWFITLGKFFVFMEVRSRDTLTGPSNFKWSAKPGCDPHSVTYIEHGSKNRPGGLSSKSNYKHVLIKTIITPA